MKISGEVRNAAQEAREELSPILPQMDFEVFSKYNRGYLKYKKDPVTYFVDLEMNRFLHTANYIYSKFPPSTRILDIGVFIPVLPIMLAKLGYGVEAIEKLSLYENTLDPILKFIQTRYNIKIHNLDIIHDDTAALHDQFDAVLLMAILEHLNGSPKELLETCGTFLRANGSLFIDVPNIASFAKRVSFFLKGKSPLPEYSDYFSSEYPFEGHNREYTLRELQYALTSTGFEIDQYEFLNVGLPPDAKGRTRLLKRIGRWGPKSWSDMIWTVSRRAQAKQRLKLR